MFYLASRTNFETVKVASTTLVDCLPGQCGTNLITGVKRCPTGNGIISTNPANEVCNSPFVCDNPITPFAVLSDGSTNFQGICEAGVTCPCLATQTCPDYVLSTFTPSNGNAYATLNGQRILFPQSNVYTVGPDVLDTPPIPYTAARPTFCTVPLAWLPLSNPGCSFNDQLSYDDVVTCMGLASPCGLPAGSFANPCLQGTLAFITDDSAGLTQADIQTTQMGCVRGEPCPCGSVAIYDTQLSGIVCSQLS